MLITLSQQLMYHCKQQCKLCWQVDGCSAANEVVNDFWKVNVLRREKMTHSEMCI